MPCIINPAVSGRRLCRKKLYSRVGGGEAENAGQRGQAPQRGAHGSYQRQAALDHRGDKPCLTETEDVAEFLSYSLRRESPAVQMRESTPLSRPQQLLNDHSSGHCGYSFIQWIGYEIGILLLFYVF